MQTAPDFISALGLRPVGREVQVGEQDLPLAQARDLHRLRLLDLHDHVRGGEHGVGAVSTISAPAAT